MTFGADKRLGFPLLFVSSTVYMSLGSFENCKQNSFLHLQNKTVFFTSITGSGFVVQRLYRFAQFQADGRKFLDRFKSYSGSQISSQELNDSISTDCRHNLQQKVSFIIYFCL